MIINSPYEQSTGGCGKARQFFGIRAISGSKAKTRFQYNIGETEGYECRVFFDLGGAVGGPKPLIIKHIASESDIRRWIGRISTNIGGELDFLHI